MRNLSLPGGAHDPIVVGSVPTSTRTAWLVYAHNPIDEPWRSSSMPSARSSNAFLERRIRHAARVRHCGNIKTVMIVTCWSLHAINLGRGDQITHSFVQPPARTHPLASRPPSTLSWKQHPGIYKVSHTVVEQLSDREEYLRTRFP
jgi:hypothetical protein